MSGKFACTVNRNNVPVDGAPITIPIAPRTRDYARESKQGNSVSYALRRLGKEAEEDPEVRVLFEKVKARELSPNAAMVRAGFRRRAMQIPLDPEGAARAIRRRFAPDQIAVLVRLLFPGPGTLGLPGGPPRGD